MIKSNMRNIIYLPFVLFLGCAAPKVHKTSTIFAPSVNTVKTDVAKAQNAVLAAARHNDELNKNLTKLASHSSRIDAKAQVILDNWSKARERENLNR